MLSHSHLIRPVSLLCVYLLHLHPPLPLLQSALVPEQLASPVLSPPFGDRRDRHPAVPRPSTGIHSLGPLHSVQSRPNTLGRHFALDISRSAHLPPVAILLVAVPRDRIRRSGSSPVSSPGPHSYVRAPITAVIFREAQLLHQRRLRLRQCRHRRMRPYIANSHLIDLEEASSPVAAPANHEIRPAAGAGVCS